MNTNVKVIGSTRIGIKPESTALNSCSKTNAGGVACYDKKSILFSSVTKLPFDSSACESLFLQIKGRSRKTYFIGVVYRHPKASIQEFQKNVSQTLNFLEHYK